MHTNVKIDKRREEIAFKAISSWQKLGCKGTIESATGTGKNFMALHAINSMPKKSTIIWLYEVTDRKNTILEEINLYNNLYKASIIKDYYIIFMTYQSAYKISENKYDLVIADEIHDSLTPSYFNFYLQNTFDKILGLSAGIDKEKKYDNGYTKGTYLDSVAPICFSYSLNDSIKNNTSRNVNIYLIKLKLDNKYKNIKSGNNKKTFYVTEQEYYNYYTKLYQKSLISNPYLCKHALRKRNEIIYDNINKIKLSFNLIHNLKGKTLIFGNSLEYLSKLKINTVSSKNTDKFNNDIINSFNTGNIKNIGSFKKLKQGANLKNLDNVIITSYYSKSLDFIQRFGRLRKSNKIGNVFIFLTENTVEEKWYKKMISDLDIKIQEINDLDTFLKTM